MKKIVLVIIVLLTLLCTCNTIKTVSLIRKVKLSEKEYCQEINFREEQNIVIVTVRINGKEHDFMFDTGAINVVSDKIADESGFKSKSRMKGTDAQGSTETMTFTSIDKISVGELEYFKTGAAIMDFSENLKELKCMNISGIIGANVFRKSVCQIDFERHKIIITDNCNKINIPENSYYIDFEQDITGTPLVKIEAYGVVCNNKSIDYGSDGYIDLTVDEFNNITLNHKIKFVRSFGTYGKGVFGEGKQDTLFTGLIDSLKIGNLFVDSNIVFFKKSANVIGTEFLKRYIVTLDWPNNKMILSPYKKDYKNSFVTYGFSPLFKDDKIIVAQIFQKSSASEAGLSIGDEILKINDKSLKNIPPDGFCDLFLNGIFPKGDNIEEIELTFLSKGKEKTVVLRKEKLL